MNRKRGIKLKNKSYNLNCRNIKTIEKNYYIINYKIQNKNQINGNKQERILNCINICIIQFKKSKNVISL